jgi:hypothetical protein
MAHNISLSVVNSVLDDYPPPPGLYIPYEPKSNNVSSSTLNDIKFKLEYELATAKQKIIEIEFNLSKITELINTEKAVKENQEVNKTPTLEFISEIYKLFSKESKIQLSNIPHKLPKHILPPKGYSGLFSNWLEQVPGLKKETITKNSKKIYLYYLELDQMKNHIKICWQKKRGKQCNNLNEKGQCKYCTVDQN